MDITIIIPTYKRPEILERTLNSFKSLNLKNHLWEILVVDNTGDPSTKNIVLNQKQFLPLQYLVEKKSGKNNALNHAIPKTQGQLLVFTDDDIIAHPDWLLQLWEGAQRWPDHSVFGGRIIADWPDGVPFWGDDHPLNQSLFSLHCPTLEERPYGDKDFLPYGPNLAIRREIFDKGYRYNTEVGPDGSNTYVMGSETELLQRLKNDGYDPVFLPKAVVQHQIRESQLTRKGLNRRNFRIGLSDSFSGPQDFALFWDAPRYLWKRLAVTWAKFLIAKIFFNKINAFQYHCSLWRLRGKIYGNRSKKHGRSFLQTILKLGV